MHILKRLLFTCGILFLSFGINVAMAQGPMPQARQRSSQQATHLLVRAEDLQPFGDVDILASPKRIQPNEMDIPNVVRGWKQGYKVDMLILTEDGQVAMVNSAVYTFAHAMNAQQALEKIPDPERLSDFAWQGARQDTAVLEQQDIQALNGRYWRAWQGVDDEGVPAYVIWLQDGANVAELHLNVAPGQEAFGQMLFRSLIEILLERIRSSERVVRVHEPVEVMTVQSTTKDLQPIQTAKLAPGVEYPVAVEGPVLSEPVEALGLSPLALLDIWLNVPRLSQNDPAYKNDVMQSCGMTIGQAGCALASASMVFKYYGTNNKNPDRLNTCMGNKACPFWWIYGAEHCSERKATYVGYYNFSYSTLVWALESGRPPILKLSKSDKTHWVVVNAVHGNGFSPDDFRINDPWNGINKNLASYTNNGWTLSNIVVYGKR